MNPIWKVGFKDKKWIHKKNEETLTSQIYPKNINSDVRVIKSNSNGILDINIKNVKGHLNDLILIDGKYLCSVIQKKGKTLKAKIIGEINDSNKIKYFKQVFPNISWTPTYNEFNTVDLQSNDIVDLRTQFRYEIIYMQ